MDISIIEQNILNLSKSPLFYLFSSSKELFHTNFWYWLYQLDSSKVLKLFGENSTTDIECQRESKQQNGIFKSKIDFLIEKESKPYLVIENKVKDFPKKEQLSRIYNSFKDSSNISFIVVSLFKYDGMKFDNWIIKTYFDLATNIRAEDFSKNKYYISLIQDYKDFCLNLDVLAKALPISESYDFSNKHNQELFNILNRIKFWESYQKIRASHLLNHFEKETIDIKTEYSINHQKATLDFYYSLKNNYRIGISIENNQFRYVVAGKNAETFARNLLEKKVFFTHSRKRGERDFLKYGATYRYQYEIIEKSLTFKSLFKKIIESMEKIDIHIIEDKIPFSN